MIHDFRDEIVYKDFSSLYRIDDLKGRMVSLQKGRDNLHRLVLSVLLVRHLDGHCVVSSSLSLLSSFRCVQLSNILPSAPVYCVSWCHLDLHFIHKMIVTKPRWLRPRRLIGLSSLIKSTWGAWGEERVKHIEIQKWFS